MAATPPEPRWRFFGSSIDTVLQELVKSDGIGADQFGPKFEQYPCLEINRHAAPI
jgi:hypothetical protein